MISVASDSKVYGSTTTQANLSFTNGSVATSTGYSVSGLLGSDSVTGVTLSSPGALASAGVTGSPYMLSASNAQGTNNLSNYLVTYLPSVLLVTPKPLTVTVANQSMSYGASSLPSFTHSISGLVAGDTTTISLSTSARAFNGSSGSASNVGTYPITAIASSNPNYSVNSVDGVLTVNPVNLSILASHQSTRYGDPLVLAQTAALGAFSTSGLVNGDYVASATIVSNVSQTGQGGSNTSVVSGAINAATYTGNLLISAAVGQGLSNYIISYTPANLIVQKAVLTVTVAPDAKFVSQTDAQGSATNCAGSTCTGGYAGVMYSGFKNGDTAASLNTSGLVIARQGVANQNTNASGEPHGAGVYTGVLQANGLSSNNYAFEYVPGNYTVVPAAQLLIKTGALNTVYGSTPNYNATTAQYIFDQNSAPISLAVTVTGNTVSVTDNANGGAQFSIVPVNGRFSGSNQLSVGSYSLTTAESSITGTNFSNQLILVGGLTVTPQTLTFNQLGITGVGKVYDGSSYMSNLAVSVAPNAFLSGDRVSVAVTGAFASKNVGTDIAYTVSSTFSGLDASNYMVSGGATHSGTNGAITQLNSVTYTGPGSGGAWSNPANWTTTGTNQTGAIPDLSNVANVIIPNGMSVVYDDAVAGPVTSTVNNQGNLLFNLSNNQTIGMPITGSGSVRIGNAGVLTLSGANSYTGGTHIQAGSTLIAGNSLAMGATPSITSLGSALAPASLGTSAGIVLPELTMSGGVSRLVTSITTTGPQTYDDLVIGSSANQTFSLQTTNSPIRFLGRIDGANDKSQSLVANAGTGDIVVASHVGSRARLNNLSLTGGRIFLLADILTAMHQTYTGAVWIGDATYLNRNPEIGFLLMSHRHYFEYNTGALVSTIQYLNQNPLYIRTLISEDPNVTFHGPVNDLIANTHTLLVGVIAPDNSLGSDTASKLNFMGAVGQLVPLYSLNAQVVVSQTQTNALSNYIGTLSVTNSVTTFADQTYRANLMTARASSQPGTVTFNVYDPNASLTYLLPLQTSEAGAGQMNLQNPNSLDSLVMNGFNNYATRANTSGTDNWGARFENNPPLNYVPPVNNPPLNYVPPVIQPPAPIPLPTYTPPLDEFAKNMINSAGINDRLPSRVLVSMQAPGELTGNTVRLTPNVLTTISNPAEIMPPAPGMVNVLVQVVIGNSRINLATSSPMTGFKFNLPENLMPNYAQIKEQLVVEGMPSKLQINATQADGKPLPSWLKFDSQTKTFTADQIPEGTPDTPIRLQIIHAGNVVEEILFVIDIK